MGEMADMYDDYGYWDDDEWEISPDDYLHLSDDELREATVLTRDPKLISIRRWVGNLSEKQRWCLANWICNRERRYEE